MFPHASECPHLIANSGCFIVGPLTLMESTAGFRASADLLRLIIRELLCG